MLISLRKYSFLTLIILIFATGTCVCDVWDDADQQRFLEDFIPELYLKYRKALDSSHENTLTFRRVLSNNKEYSIHVNKLKDVNGYKRHNLIVKEKSDDNPLIYVNNPVETKIPNAYLSLEGFKNLLTGRVLRQRKEFQKPLKTYGTLKPVQHTTRIPVLFNKVGKKYTKVNSNNVTKTKNKTTKIVTKINKTTVYAIPVIDVENITNKTVRNTSKSELASNPVTKTVAVSNVVIEETTRNTPTLDDNVIISTDISTRQLNESSSTNSLPGEHHILRTNTKETTTESKNTVEGSSISSSNMMIDTESTLNESQEIGHKAMLEDTVPRFSEKSTTKESTTEESILEATTIEELTTKEPTTEELSSEEPGTKEPTTEALTTKEIKIEESTTTESSTEEPTTKMLTTTVKTTIQSKITTLGRPLVFMGGWENGN